MGAVWKAAGRASGAVNPFLVVLCHTVGMSRSRDHQAPIRGALLLGEVAAQLPVLEVACTRCERLGRLYTDRLVAQHGANIPMPELLRLLSADCPKRLAGRWHDICGAHFPVLERLRL